jgi:hypothetical protein
MKSLALLKDVLSQQMCKQPSLFPLLLYGAVGLSSMRRDKVI